MSAGLALAASLLWGAADFLGGTLSRRLPALSVLLASQTLAAAALIGIVCFSAGLDPLPARSVVIAVVAGACWMFGLGAFYQALALGQMGVVAPVASSGVVLPVAIGLLLGERPGIAQLVGIVIAVGGVILCAGPKPRRADQGNVAIPLVLALLAAGCFGTEITLLDRIGGAQNLLASLSVIRVTAVALLIVAAVAQRAGRGHGRHRAVPPSVVREQAWRLLLGLLGLGLMDLAAMAAYTVAGADGSLCLVAVLASLYPAVTMVLAQRIHRERLLIIQRLGALATLGGAMLITI